MLQALSSAGVVAGAFNLRFQGERGFLLRLVECTANWRTRWFQMPFGAQPIFLSRQTFLEVGGYAEIPLMEDLEMVWRLKRRGRILILPSCVRRSARRYNKDGPARRTPINKLVFFGYLTGASPERLLQWHSGIASRSGTPRV